MTIVYPARMYGLFLISFISLLFVDSLFMAFLFTTFLFMSLLMTFLFMAVLFMAVLFMPSFMVRMPRINRPGPVQLFRQQYTHQGVRQGQWRQRPAQASALITSVAKAVRPAN